MKILSKHKRRANHILEILLERFEKRLKSKADLKSDKKGAKNFFQKELQIMGKEFQIQFREAQRKAERERQVMERMK